MKISRDWLSDYIDLSAYSDADLAKRLTEIGHAVESIEKHGADSVFEIEFTTNRIDAMSHFGLARDLAAAFGVDVKRPEAPSYPSASTPEVAVTIEAPELCDRYTALLVRDVSVKPSSPEIRHRLEAVGLRPINNVVDATNYVMMAVGHPLHAFDLALLEGPAINVRRGGDGEKVRSLDGVERQLDRATTVIADARKAVGLGGMIGGENSEIRDSTKNVLLECAHFNAAATRTAARRMGLKTDASYRFERGVDPNDTILAISLAAELIQREAGGTPGSIIDVVAEAQAERKLLLREARLKEASAGMVGIAYALQLFTRLGMQPRQVSEGLEVSIPSYRVDMHEEADLIEEVLRYFGFNSIPASLPRVTTGDVVHDAVADAEETVRDLLVSFGLTEAITYSFVNAKDNAAFTEEKPLDLTNALTEQIASMRLSLIPGLLHVIAHNRAYGNRDGALFEVGRTYHRTDAGIVEKRCAAFALFGARPSSWGEEKKSYDFFDAKGMVEALAERLRIPVSFAQELFAYSRKGQSARAASGERAIARVSAIQPAILQSYDIKGDVIAGEIDIEALVASVGDWQMKPASRFPGVPMVVGMWHGRDLSYQKIVETIEGLSVPFLQEIGVWDRFVPEKGEHPGEVKTALGLWYQSTERSLTQEEVAEAHRSLTQRVTQLLPVHLITQ
jgi:phenylalanyl-tRNA synthetase beta chain